MGTNHHSQQTIACLDGSQVSRAVCDAASWCAHRLETPLLLLNAIERDPYGAADLTGQLGFGARTELLQALADADATRSRVALAHGRAVLSEAQRYAEVSFDGQVTTLQRHSPLLDALTELSDATRLVVMGRQGDAHPGVEGRLGVHVEHVARGLKQPLLMIRDNFRVPEHVMLAYDGSPTAEQAAQRMIGSPLFTGLAIHVVMVGEQTSERERVVQTCVNRFEDAGFDVRGAQVEGEVAAAICAYQTAHAIGLTVMGAYGHSRVRHWLLGSHTSELLRVSTTPVLLLR